ncbi:hypothetical protein M408DRAFT_17979 [Serendipita vermifera MAFF 305830]|uniref:Rho-GAP domain-containing protein n=1 Tax=Serendipita vermifera MAFF 305830 TaxID=933852 RepID=A0A0C3AEK9_SERVB|nr:hypothetical protein M408DRAFT_17979 [Serendipita vermifera MAFF 305830]
MESSINTPPAGTIATTSTAPVPLPDPQSLKCSSCNSAITSQYVRALGGIYHATCFRCMDCNEIVTAKFFSFSLADSKQVPLCEVDYFRRLDLLCAKCGQALRGSYITASGHCQTAILRQFVEVNRSSRDEAYHLPCHLIQKFWNVKISTPLALPASDSQPWTAEETIYTPATLRSSQKRMDELVHRVWTVLSAYEESSAACISDLLKAVSTAVYLEAIRSAERFVFHVEVLFAALDDLEFHFEAHGAPTISSSSSSMSSSSLASGSNVSLKGMAHVRESRVLCRKTVDLFTSLAHAQREASRQGMTQDLLGLITGIAHYLKILLRIALLGALRLMREYNDSVAIKVFLDQLRTLMEENGDPLASRRIHEPVQSNGTSSGKAKERESIAPSLDVTFEGRPLEVARSREGVAFGFKSLDPEVTGNSPYAQEYFDQQNGTRIAAEFVAPSDLCVKCNMTIENNCVRLGTYTRWHLHCLSCNICGRTAGPKPESKGKDKEQESRRASKSAYTGDPEKDEDSHEEKENNETEITKKETRTKMFERLRIEADAEAFTFDMTYDPMKAQQEAESGFSSSLDVPDCVYCPAHRSATGRLGFKSVSRLEQYSYLLNVALLRLYSILKRRGAIQPPSGSLRRRVSSPRESMDLVRLRTVSLDRQNTTVKTPKRLTIIESPVGKSAQTTELAGINNLSKSPPKSQKPPTPPSQSQKPSTPPSQHQKPFISPTSSPKKRGNRPGTPPSPTNRVSVGADTDNVIMPASAEAVPIASITEPAASGSSSTRPSFTRMNSQVVVMEEVPPAGTVLADMPVRTASPIPEEVTDDEHESLRLADISSLMEADKRSVLSAGLGSDAPFLSDLDPMDTVLVKHAALWLLNHSELKDKFDADDVLEGIEIRKGGLWNKFFRGEKKVVKKKGVFGVPLDLLTERDGVDSTLGVTRNPVRIPTFLDDILSALKQMDVSVEGIFRKNGNIRRVKEAIEALDRESGGVDFSQENAIQLAALLKKFFIDLPDPLLTHRLHNLFMSTQTVTDPAERTRLLHLALTLLPKSHRSTMEVLLAFLKWVALFANIDSVGSRMDIPNLSTVIAPSILSSKSGDPLQSYAAISVVTQMLQEQDSFNRVPEECLDILNDKKGFSGFESSKDLLKKCEKHYRGKSSNPIKSPVTSPTTIQFAPNTLHNHKSEGSLDGRGRATASTQGKDEKW